jgi:DNA-binding transcriptional ArsR family regulator
LEVDWKSLHKTLSDETRRSILELLAEKGTLSYTEIMTLLQITNTGRLNYHLKALANLVSKDDEGKYRLTEQGRLAASLVSTFPEKVKPEKKQSPLKIAVAVVLILVGVLLIVSLLFIGLGLASPTAVSSTQNGGVSGWVIPQNTTISLPSWTVSTGPLTLSWSASSPIHLYVLNETQYDVLLFQHSSGGQVQPTLQNFTGLPSSSVESYYLQTDNVSLSLPQGQYHFFAGSRTRAVLDTFEISQTQEQAGTRTSLSPMLLFYVAIFIALGVLFIALGVSIVTRRIWH